MPLARAGEIELSYERAGSGPPLLMIMGLSGTRLHWGEPFLTALREDFETIVYDHRGVGASSRVERSFTTAQLAEDAAGLLDALGLDSVHVLGISMGGMVAQELALAQPACVSTLALGCTYCGGAGSVLPAQPEMAQAIMSGDRERATRSMWEHNVCPRVAADDDLYGAFREIGQRGPVAREVIMEQLTAIAAHDTSERLSRLEMPTLIVHGTLDRILPVENARAITERMPGARVEILEEVGHLFFWEQPERAAELVRAHAAVHA